MKKTHENSHLEWLTQKDIEANNESEFYVIVQVSEKIACPVIRVKNNLQCEICFLCEVVDREEYEKTTQKGKIKELKKKIHKLKEEERQSFGKVRRGRGNRKRRGTQTPESGRNDRRNESRVQGTRTRVRRFAAGDRFVIQNTRSERVKTRTRVSSIYKEEILTVLVMGINKSDTIIFNI